MVDAEDEEHVQVRRSGAKRRAKRSTYTSSLLDLSYEEDERTMKEEEDVIVFDDSQFRLRLDLAREGPYHHQEVRAELSYPTVL